MKVDVVVRDLLARPPEWDVRREHPAGAPAVDVLCPAFRPELDGADMLSLVMPPPAEVRFRIDARDAPATMRMRAGVDVSAVRRLGRRAGEGRFVFEVRLNGERVHRSTVALDEPEERSEGPRASEWQDVGGPGGVPVEPGDEVTLITRAERESGMPIDPEAAVPAGFGGLRLERRERIARMRSSPASPNVVLVVMDTLRLDRLACYGYERPTSPNLDRLAARGTLFTDPYVAASWTWPSTASILTALQPEEHGVRTAGSCFLGWELETLAEALQRAGLTTAAWTANPLIAASHNFDQGFEVFEDGPVMRRAGTFYGEVSRWLERQAGTRFFLYLHFTEPHRPFEPLPEGRRLFAADVPDARIDDARRIADRLEGGGGFDADGRSRLDEIVDERERREISDLYDACVWTGDHWFGRVLDDLERLGLDDETIVVFTSDHGEEIFERSYLGHSKSVYRELVRTPLVLAGPGVPAGRRAPGPVSNVHLGRLVASLAGVRFGAPLDAQAFFDGAVDRGPVLYSTDTGFWNGFRGVTIHGTRWEDYSVQRALGAGEWGGEPGDDLQARLFDLGSDPGERDDLVGREGVPYDEALRVLEQRFEALDPASHAGEHRTGTSTQRLLDHLGYAGH